MMTITTFKYFWIITTTTTMYLIMTKNMNVNKCIKFTNCITIYFIYFINRKLNNPLYFIKKIII